MGGYTPGPWAIYRDGFLYGVRRSVDGWSQSICRVDWKIQGNPDGEAQANARLIAAAPELLEALREGRRAIGDHHAPNDCYATGPLTGDDYRDLVECPACRFIAMYDAAISRATGEGE